MFSLCCLLGNNTCNVCEPAPLGKLQHMKPHRTHIRSQAVHLPAPQLSLAHPSSSGECNKPEETSHLKQPPNMFSWKQICVCQCVDMQLPPPPVQHLCEFPAPASTSKNPEPVPSCANGIGGTLSFLLAQTGKDPFIPSREFSSAFPEGMTFSSLRHLHAWQGKSRQQHHLHKNLDWIPWGTSTEFPKGSDTTALRPTGGLAADH